MGLLPAFHELAVSLYETMHGSPCVTVSGTWAMKLFTWLVGLDATESSMPMNSIKIPHKMILLFMFISAVSSLSVTL